MTVVLIGKVAEGLVAITGVGAGGVGGLTYYGGLAAELSNANGIGDGIGDTNAEEAARNAIEHALTSGELTDDWDRATAENFGDLLEFTSKWRELFDPTNLYELDTLKDQWNNEVGRRMAEWAERNGHDWDSIYDDLIMNALEKNAKGESELITDPGDERIDPAKNPNPNPTWTEPSQGWQGSGNPIPTDPGQSEEAHTGGLGGMGSGSGLSGGGISGFAGAAMAAIMGAISGLFRDPPASPLVIDLGNGRIDLVSLQNSTALFDLFGNNFGILTGWVAPQDGFLAYDKNNNGTIDNIGELFGNATTDGFVVLDGYDSNNDNKITSADTIFKQLRVWRDLDQDGYSDVGELKTLAQTAIKEINLNYTPLTNVTNQGHEISSRSTVMLTNNTTATIEDVWGTAKTLKQLLSEYVLASEPC
jgi:hypothetical protein